MKVEVLVSNFLKIIKFDQFFIKFCQNFFVFLFRVEIDAENPLILFFEVLEVFLEGIFGVFKHSGDLSLSPQPSLFPEARHAAPDLAMRKAVLSNIHKGFTLAEITNISLVINASTIVSSSAVSPRPSSYDIILQFLTANEGR